jgi:hypothetical protein
MKTSWKPITKANLEVLIANSLPACEISARDLFERIKIDPIKIKFQAGRRNDELHVIARCGNKVVYYDDTEDGFEVGIPNADGILRSGTGQFTLAQVLLQLESGSR